MQGQRGETGARWYRMKHVTITLNNATIPFGTMAPATAPNDGRPESKRAERSIGPAILKPALVQSLGGKRA